MPKKTTGELLETMKGSREYPEYLKENPGELASSFLKIDRALQSLLAEKGLRKSEVIARSGLEVHYGYQIFSGVKTPTRDKVLMLCCGMGLTVEETQRLLQISGYPQLYARNGRDNAILFGITHGQSIIELNNLLYEQNFDLLL